MKEIATDMLISFLDQERFGVLSRCLNIGLAAMDADFYVECEKVIDENGKERLRFIFSKTEK